MTNLLLSSGVKNHYSEEALKLTLKHYTVKFACAISPDEALDTSPSPDAYKKGHIYVLVANTSGRAINSFKGNMINLLSVLES